MTTIIGLTGERGVGKSEAALIFEKYGFVRLHTFAPGKRMVEAYFAHLGYGQDMIRKLVHGELRDQPCNMLPDNQTPRFFMEQFGYFMGMTLGPAWTLGVELNLQLEVDRETPVVFESLVYEAGYLKARGGKIVKIIRPGFTNPKGINSDKAVNGIMPDYMISNEGSLADLEREVKHYIESVL